MENDDTMLSRAANREKLTIVTPLTIRQTESMARDIQMLADLQNMDRSEYIRHLVELDKKRQKEIWDARNALFANSQESATNAAPDSVGRGES